MYVSAAHPLFTSADVADILEVSRRNYARDTITGLLVYKSGSVIQFLEGPPEAVRALFCGDLPRSAALSRHKDLRGRDSAEGLPRVDHGISRERRCLSRLAAQLQQHPGAGFRLVDLESSKARSILQAFIKEIR